MGWKASFALLGVGSTLLLSLGAWTLQLVVEHEMRLVTIRQELRTMHRFHREVAEALDLEDPIEPLRGFTALAIDGEEP